MDNVIVRLARIEDVMQIAMIHVKTYQYAYKGHMPDEYLDKLSVEDKVAQWKTRLENPPKGIQTFVAEQDGKVVGWCTVGLNRDEDATAEIGNFYAIYIDVDCIGKKIGTKLMNKGLEWLKKEGYQKATLWVITENESARQFYEKRGWRVEGKTKIDKRFGKNIHETRYIIDLL